MKTLSSWTPAQRRAIRDAGQEHPEYAALSAAFRAHNAGCSARLDARDWASRKAAR